MLLNIILVVDFAQMVRKYIQMILTDSMPDENLQDNGKREIPIIENIEKNKFKSNAQRHVHRATVEYCSNLFLQKIGQSKIMQNAKYVPGNQTPMTSLFLTIIFRVECALKDTAERSIV